MENEMELHSTRTTVACAALIAVTVSVVATGCGGGNGNEPKASPAQAASTASRNTSHDPLEGEWRTEFTCRESVRAIARRLTTRQIERQVGGWDEYLAVFQWHPKPVKGDPCHGASETPVALLARFGDGNLALCDATTGECEVQATYELVGDHAIEVNDPEGNLCPCPAKWTFELDGDELTFRVPANAFVLGTWEAAPWQRAS